MVPEIPYIFSCNLFSRKIFFAAIAAIFICHPPISAQVITFTQNAYKTALPINEVGDWNDPETWEMWDGEWIPATVPPARNNDVFIEKDKEVQLTQDQEVGNLYIYGEDIMGNQPGKKINLQSENLHVYGALRSFGGVDGNFYLHPLTSGILDWIYPETGNIVFRGTSRTVVDRSSWSANNGNSRFGVIFNPDVGETLTVNAGFKANSFLIQSGTVIQSLNTEVTEATSTFSFNTQPFFGPGAYGDFIIEPGATLISNGTKEFGEIIRRSDSKPAANFQLKEGATLILTGEEPVMNAENVLLEGGVYYASDAANQQFLNKTMVDAQTPNTYNNLFFEGNATKTLPPFLNWTGDWTYIEGGPIIGDASTLLVTGERDQRSNTAIEVANLEIIKPSGTLYMNGDLSILNHFTMTMGEVDFLDNQLHINISGDGSYTYYSGTWKNLGQLDYLNLPAGLAASNTTFPFEDQQLGGVRKIFLMGSHTFSNIDLTIDYTQLPEVNWDPNFNDYDGTPILYKVNSYFTFTVTGSSGGNIPDPDNASALELVISADNLVVVDPGDLRIVGDTAASPGTHLQGIEDNGVYFARRFLDINDLSNIMDQNSETFTIGSTGITSVLPVSWLSYAAEELVTGNLISWSTRQEIDHDRFIVLKSQNGGDDFVEIGEVIDPGNTTEIQHYRFLDKGINRVQNLFYQIKQVSLDGGYELSPVFSLKILNRNLTTLFKIFPNPYEQGELNLVLQDEKKNFYATIGVKNTSGVKLIQESGSFEQVAQSIIESLMKLPPGAYLITIETSGDIQVLKWLKKN